MTQDQSDRGLFFKTLNTILARSSDGEHTIAVLLVRLLRLRDINFEYGFSVGDEIVERVLENLQSIQRPTDAIFRITASDLVLILPRLQSAALASLAADKIATIFKEQLSVEGEEINVSVAIGVAIAPEHGKDSVELLRCADIAASHAERSFASYQVYAGEISQSEDRKLWMESSLEKAIANNEIEMHYQPQIDLESNSIVGLEALARWRHETRGPVRPDIFVGMAEQTGLILPLTMLTFNIALRECAEFLQNNRNCVLGFNLSAAILQQDYLAQQLLDAIRIWNVRPEQLTMEITETAIMANPEEARKKLEELRDHNINISMDDFGTGYSSLGYLQTLPLNEVKIDKSFVMNMVRSEGDMKIARAVIDLAHNFDFEVVAEGIEDAETMKVLADLGCDMAQGYFIAKPMPIMEIDEWVSGSPYALSRAN